MTKWNTFIVDDATINNIMVALEIADDVCVWEVKPDLMKIIEDTRQALQTQMDDEHFQSAMRGLIGKAEGMVEK